MNDLLRWKDIYELVKRMLGGEVGNSMEVRLTNGVSESNPCSCSFSYKSNDIICANIRKDIIVIGPTHTVVICRSGDKCQYRYKYDTADAIDPGEVGFYTAGVLFIIYQIKRNEYFPLATEPKECHIEIDEEAYAENHDDHFLKNLSDNHPELKWLQREAALDESRKESEEDHRVLLDAENIINKTPEQSSVSPNFKKIIVKDPEVHNYHYIIPEEKIEQLFETITALVWSECGERITLGDYQNTIKAVQLKNALIDAFKEEIC